MYHQKYVNIRNMSCPIMFKTQYQNWKRIAGRSSAESSYPHMIAISSRMHPIFSILFFFFNRLN